MKLLLVLLFVGPMVQAAPPSKVTTGPRYRVICVEANNMKSLEQRLNSQLEIEYERNVIISVSAPSFSNAVPTLNTFIPAACITINYTQK